MTSTSTLRPTTPSPESTVPSTTDLQRRNRRLGLLVTTGVAVAALATGAVVWAAAGSEPTATTSSPAIAGHESAAAAGALVGHGTTVLAAEAPVVNDAAAGALVGHGTTVVAPHLDAPAVSDADAGALVGNQRS